MTPVVTTGPIQALLAIPMLVGECPLWHPREQVLYWVDIPGKALHQFNPANQIHRHWLFESEPAALAWSQNGGLILAMRAGFFHFDPQSEILTPIADAPYDPHHIRCNDGRVDARGRFWVGTLYEPRDKPAADMLCLDGGQVRQVWHGGMTVSNGLAFGSDPASGQPVLFHADTTSHQIRRHDLDLEQGSVGPAQLLREFSKVKDASYGGRPDGAAVDSEGAYWCAMFEGSRLLRLAPDGTLLQEFPLPVRCPTMLAFGGPDYQTLYITSASQNRHASELIEHPLTGRVLTMHVSVAGLPEHAYLP